MDNTGNNASGGSTLSNYDRADYRIEGAKLIEAGDVTNAEIPFGVETIGDEAFMYCRSLTRVFIPNGVTTIGARAFEGCDSLACINIPDSVTTIGDYAFCDCGKLTRIDIPDSVTSVGRRAFQGCTSLPAVNFNGTKQQWEEIIIPNKTLYRIMTKSDRKIYRDLMMTHRVICSDGAIKKSKDRSALINSRS